MDSLTNLVGNFDLAFKIVNLIEKKIESIELALAGRLSLNILSIQMLFCMLIKKARPSVENWTKRLSINTLLWFILKRKRNSRWCYSKCHGVLIIISLQSSDWRNITIVSKIVEKMRDVLEVDKFYLSNVTMWFVRAKVLLDLNNYLYPSAWIPFRKTSMG